MVKTYFIYQVVREFCAKGSLFDVLRNDDIRIDQLYLASFVEDLLKVSDEYICT